MGEWKEYRLSEIGTIVGGATPSTKNPSFYDGEIPWITPKDLTDWNEVYISRGERSITMEGYNSSSCKLMPKGTVLFTSRAPIGYIAIAANELCTNQGFKSVVPNKELVDSEFLYYALLYNKNKIKALGSGTTFAEISGKVMASVVISLPELATQKRIAAQLSEIDDKIAVNRRICENLEAQAQALFKHWFIDFAPFKNGKLVESELGMIPEGWRVGSPYEYVEFIYGAPYKSNLFNDKKDGLPLIRIRDLKDCSPQFYTPEILPKSEYVKAGDILAGMDAEFAPYIWKGQKGLLNQRVCKIKPKNASIGRLFCMLLVKPQLLFVQAVKTGTTVSHIGKSDIDRFKVVLPPFEEVVKYSKIGEEILEAIVTLSAENQRLSTLRDTLLPKLMSGDLIINNV